MADQRFKIESTQPTTYQDPIKGVINGVLVRFTILPYQEVHEIRLPAMNAAAARTAIMVVVDERDQLEELKD